MFYNVLFSATVFMASYAYFRVKALSRVRKQTNQNLGITTQ